MLVTFPLLIGAESRAMQFKRKQLDDDDDVDEGHPLQSLIITANASLTREHTRDYHRGLERC